ncbi:MAG: PRC-barrel domain-containing protein [Planctomycetota bacterium]
MLRSVLGLRGYTLECRDGSIGHVKDILFDDEFWRARYLVIDTSRFLSGDRVLIAPHACGEPDWETQSIPVAMDCEQVEGAPSIDEDAPVSRRVERSVLDYFDWVPYWATPFPPGIAPLPMHVVDKEIERGNEVHEEDQQHLRSAHEVKGYAIAARDDDIGHVADLICSTDDWTIRYLVVDTRNWLPGRKVLIAPAWIEKISFANHHVRVDHTAEQVRDAPTFDPEAPVNRSYEQQLYDYYGRPVYW